MWRKKLSCTECGGSGPFRKEKKGRFGLTSRCVVCLKKRNDAWLASPKGRASRMWTLIVQRCRIDSHYADVTITMTRAEFIAWAIPAVTKWLKKHTGTPSVDRKDHNAGYCLGNIRIIAWNENSRTRPYNKNVHAPSGTAWCGKCARYLKKKLFSSRPSRPAGVQGVCRKCHAKYMQKYKKRKKE